MIYPGRYKPKHSTHTKDKTFDQHNNHNKSALIHLKKKKKSLLFLNINSTKNSFQINSLSTYVSVTNYPVEKNLRKSVH